MSIITAVKYQEEPEEPVCHNVAGNGKRDGAKAERSYRITICCNTSDDFFIVLSCYARVCLVANVRSVRAG